MKTIKVASLFAGCGGGCLGILGGETHKGWRKYSTKKAAVQDFCNFTLNNFNYGL